MKNLFSIIIILFTVNANSQNELIKKIRERYKEATEENFQVHELNFSTVQAAIGTQNTKITYIYNSWQTNAEEDPYKLSHNIVKAIVKYNIAANMDYTIEYLFNKKGKLIFLFENSSSDSENNEERYYYNNNKLIKFIAKKFDTEGLKDEFTKIKNFKQADLKKANKYLIKASKYSIFFKEMIKIENLDKN